jgi:ATP-dependent Lhr-like helicase
MLRTPNAEPGCKVIYLSPLKALAVDVERNLRSPLAGIANMARRENIPFRTPEISVRTGDTPTKERARFARHPGEILITTPESLYLLLTSQAAETLRTVETIIIDEIHALVPTKRGAHMALSIERLEALVKQQGRTLQRIGLSATQRPLEEVARFLGGAEGQASTAPSTEAHLVANTAGEVPAALLEVAGQARTEAEDARREEGAILYRPVTIVNAGARKVLELRVEVPVEDMARLGEIEDLPSGPASQGPKRTSIWQSIYPSLLEIIRKRTSTLIFVNARRIAERLAGAINELAEEPIARAHHGSLSAAQRSEIEELLKAGKIKALVATSSLELGIDMGAIDLVVQIGAPPSVASGMQRIGRAGHSVGVPSAGIIYPKYRADLIACAAVTRAMHEGHVESTRFLRNPLDVLAQQIVAIIAQPPSAPVPTKKTTGEDEAPGISYDELFSIVRSSAPYAATTRNVFEGVLDMLAGRYPSDEFAELRPRITWDRNRNWLTPRKGVKMIAILNGGTIPDRGLYGVFLAGSHAKPIRVGELDEEMVFETKPGETFILGASTWRIEEITHDRVLVSPAPGDPGKIPFWHGDLAGRPLEFGRRIGALVRTLREMPRSLAITTLTQDHDLAPGAAENVLRYLADQELATVQVPDDRTIVIERVRDELGDWRMCCLTPFGSRVHIPWSMAAVARLHDLGMDVESMYTEDGFVLRFPDTDDPPPIEHLLLEPSEAAELVLRQLGSTSLFAAKFREAASRALLLPRRRGDGRTPLWQQRKRSYDLLAVASRYASFPILLEAYRECLRDVFDMPALLETLNLISNRTIRVHSVDSRTPSPFAAALLFGYMANFLYDGDAPLAERRAAVLSIDQDQLRELMGDADLRELLDLSAIEETEEQAQATAEGYRAKSMDGVHDLLLRIGDLTRTELRARTTDEATAETITKLIRARRVIEITVANEKRYIAAEDAARYRDALGVPLPPGLPTAFLVSTLIPETSTAAKTMGAPSFRSHRKGGVSSTSETAFLQTAASLQPPTIDLLRRYARTHGPFTTHEAAARFSLPTNLVDQTLNHLVQTGRVLEGAFRPGGIHREWCDHEILRTIRRKSLARLRKEVEPVEQRTLARLLTRWQGVVQPRRGLDALLDVIENLQGAPLPASILETEILPARISNYQPSDLDRLIAAGEVTWVGLDPLGERDGRIGLYLADRLTTLWPPRPPVEIAPGSKEADILALLARRGASFFQDLHDGLGGGYPGETLEALWSLVWKGLITNDAMQALRAYCEPRVTKQTKRPPQTGFRSRRTTPPTAQGRWALQPAAQENRNPTQWSHAIAQQLLTRYGVVFRETAHAENLPGGFSAIYDVMKALEESGKVRRGYFAADLGATQFAQPAAVDLLRSLRIENEAKPELLQLAATDPANPYGALLKWPTAQEGTSLTRSVGARVILIDGALAAYLRRSNPNFQVFLPEEEPARSNTAKNLSEFLVIRAQAEGGMLITSLNGTPVAEHWLAQPLLEAGFVAGAMGFHLRRSAGPVR